MKTKLMAALAIGALMLTGCGGGGGDGTSTSMVDPAGTPLSFVDLVVGDIVESGTYHLVGASDAFLEALEDEEVPTDGYAPGSMITIGGVSFRCTADNTSNCTIAVHDDGSVSTVGTIATVLFGGASPMTDTERLIAAERAKTEAEKARADAEKARADAAVAARQQAETERAREQAAKEAAEERLAQSPLERESAGFGTSAGTLVVTPRYRGTGDGIPAIIKTPDIGSPTHDRTAPWDMTTGSSSDGTYRDEVRVYSDVGPDTQVAFQDSTYNAGRRVVNTQGEIIADYPIRGARADVDGTGFPETSTPPQTFVVEDRGYDTQAQLDAATARCTADSTCITPTPNNVRDQTTHPNRYSVTPITTAELGGAGGTYRCGSSSPNTTCTVQRRGTDQLFFSGPWSFRPMSATEDVDVADAHYMWFGWWARENIATKEWSYAVGHGPAGSRVSSVSAVSGTATYSGDAIGRFAIDDPLDTTDVVGAFTADATLNADFNENTLSGTLTGFESEATDLPTQSGDTEWTVHLRKGSISGGSASGTSAWSIGVTETTDNVDEGGSWSANFYSNFPANERTGVVPYGIAGTFTAEHSGAANMIGAFGAHRPQ